jgi:calcineurin-like phosphoesterase family protein
MLPDIWFISDTHFSHGNILKFRDDNDNLIRPNFKDADHMDEVMIENWNRCVKPQDKIYHLGDITFSRQKYHKIMPRLNGKKRLIMGNHDNFKPSEYEQYFEKVMSWRSFGEFPVKFVCCHYPLHRGSFEYRAGNPGFCVHGHLHQRLINEPGYINVCVEHTNYTPIHLEELLERMK